MGPAPARAHQVSGEFPLYDKEGDLCDHRGQHFHGRGASRHGCGMRHDRCKLLQDELKDGVLARMLQPTDPSVPLLARETGIAEKLVGNWLLEDLILYFI